MTNRSFGQWVTGTATPWLGNTWGAVTDNVSNAWNTLTDTTSTLPPSTVQARSTNNFLPLTSARTLAQDPTLQSMQRDGFMPLTGATVPTNNTGVTPGMVPQQLFQPSLNMAPQSSAGVGMPASLSMEGYNVPQADNFRPIGNGITGTGDVPTDPGFWDTIGGFEGVSQGLGALSGIGQTVLGFQQLGLAEDQFDFTKNAWQRDYEMRLQDYNRRVDRQEQKDAAFART